MKASRTCWHSDLGKIDFKTSHKLQLRILDSRISGENQTDLFLFLEHFPVLTVGRGAELNHLKVSPAFLSDAGLDIFKIERGGNITYHGPGQIVLYPIIDLRRAGIGVRDFVHKLEEVMIRTTADFGVKAVRDSRNRGIWSAGKKMGFIGIAVRKGISFHGLALNVDLPLSPFEWIDPCGLADIEITSLARESKNSPPLDTVKDAMKHHIEEIFDISLCSVSNFRVGKVAHR